MKRRPASAADPICNIIGASGTTDVETRRPRGSLIDILRHELVRTAMLMLVAAQPAAALAAGCAQAMDHDCCPEMRTSIADHHHGERAGAHHGGCDCVSGVASGTADALRLPNPEIAIVAGLQQPAAAVPTRDTVSFVPAPVRVTDGPPIYLRTARIRL